MNKQVASELIKIAKSLIAQHKTHEDSIDWYLPYRETNQEFGTKEKIKVDVDYVVETDPGDPSSGLEPNLELSITKITDTTGKLSGKSNTVLFDENKSKNILPKNVITKMEQEIRKNELYNLKH